MLVELRAYVDHKRDAFNQAERAWYDVVDELSHLGCPN
jgi:hypothetical protein